jgi:hypothetical protein
MPEAMTPAPKRGPGSRHRVAPHPGQTTNEVTYTSYTEVQVHKRGPGRPRKPPSALLTVRIPPAELAAYAAKAAANHEFLSVVVRRLLEAWLRA